MPMFAVAWRSTAGGSLQGGCMSQLCCRKCAFRCDVALVSRPALCMDIVALAVLGLVLSLSGFRALLREAAVGASGWCVLCSVALFVKSGGCFRRDFGRLGGGCVARRFALCFVGPYGAWLFGGKIPCRLAKFVCFVGARFVGLCVALCLWVYS